MASGQRRLGKYAALDAQQITTQNISKLGGAWTSEKFDTHRQAPARCLVHDGLMFVTAPPSVYALDAKTGARIWRFQAGLQTGMGAPAREGVAVGDGLVFVGLSDARVVALREKTNWSGTVKSVTKREIRDRSSRARLFTPAASCRLVSAPTTAGVDRSWRSTEDR